jgi:hypothetical protein
MTTAWAKFNQLRRPITSHPPSNLVLSQRHPDPQPNHLRTKALTLGQPLAVDSVPGSVLTVGSFLHFFVIGPTELDGLGPSEEMALDTLRGKSEKRTQSKG